MAREPTCLSESQLTIRALPHSCGGKDIHNLLTQQLFDHVLIMAKKVGKYEIIVVFDVKGIGRTKDKAFK